MHPPHPPALAPAAGSAGFSVHLVDAASAVTGLRSASPMKLLTPRARGLAAWVIVSSYGGGLVEGDHLSLAAEVGQGATALLGAQASTKVYACPRGLPSRQTLRARVETGGLLVSAPEPVTCYAQACYEQSQRFDLAPGASLLALDWMTAGRVARGERWSLTRYRSLTQVFLGNRLALHDPLDLNPAEGPLDAPHRMGTHACLATLALLGPRLTQLAQRVREEVAAEPIGRRLPLIASASPLPEGGALLRVAALTTELAGAYLRRKLDGLANELGENPWARRW